MSSINVITRQELAEILVRQYGVSGKVKKHLINLMLKFNDKEIIKEAEKAGLKIWRISAERFSLQEVS